jgi:hypothetical protein
VQYASRYEQAESESDHNGGPATVLGWYAHQGVFLVMAKSWTVTLPGSLARNDCIDVRIATIEGSWE